MDGNFVSIRKFFLVFQKFCIIQKGHFWNFINCPFSYIQKVWNGILLHIKYPLLKIYNFT